MKLRIPLTGTVKREGAFGDGSLAGDNNDPIRLIDINLGNVSWQLVDIDLENEEMIIEVEPDNRISEPTGGTTPEGHPAYSTRPATKAEKLGFLQHAKDLINNYTKDELYAMTKCSRLKRPFKGKGTQ